MGECWSVTGQRAARFAGLNLEDSTPIQGCVGYEVVLCALLPILTGVNSVDVLGTENCYAFASVGSRAL